MRDKAVNPFYGAVMSAQIISINARLEATWADYVAKKERAEQSGALADGIEAGRAWRRWLDLFLTDEQRKVMGSVG